MECPFEITDDDRENLSKVMDGFQRRKTPEDIFYCLCFSLNSPQTTFTANQKVMRQLRTRQLYSKNIPYRELFVIMRPLRFRRKADYLLEARRNFFRILTVVRGDCNVNYRRDWLVKHVKGLGMKTASMFLRDLGELDLAVIDTHILKFLKRPSPSNKKQYLELERIFRTESSAQDMTCAEFDTFLWMKYSGTSWDSVT